MAYDVSDTDTTGVSGKPPGTAASEVPPNTESPLETPTPSHSDPADAPVTAETGNTLMENILQTNNPEPVVKAPAVPHAIKPSGKRPPVGLLIGVVMVLIIALPIGVFYISNRNESLTDLRSRANEPPGPYSSPITSESQCRALGGEPVSEPGSECGPGGYRKECIIGGQHYKYGCGNTGNPTEPHHQPTNTPPPVVHECSNLKILSASGTQLTPASLTPGQQVVLAVKGSGTPDQAHFRINGGSWQPSTTKNGGGEYILNWTVPSGVTDFVLEAEVHVDNVWK